MDAVWKVELCVQERVVCAGKEVCARESLARSSSWVYCLWFVRECGSGRVSEGGDVVVAAGLATGGGYTFSHMTNDVRLVEVKRRQKTVEWTRRLGPAKAKAKAKDELMMRPTERPTHSTCRKRRSIVVVAGRASVLLLQPGGRVRWYCLRSARTLACVHITHISYTTSNSLSNCCSLFNDPCRRLPASSLPARDLHGLR
jgi:hypothetical protein